MKQVLAFALIAAAIQVTGFSTAFAGDKKVCKVLTNDIGTIVGRGPTSADAFEDAATQCFDRRESLFRMKKGSNLDEETGLVMIDSCANVRCS
ncbi:MAG: hypothetical protein EOP05_19090 [Proteobacteria bacterium]|nr:MAG: hypothetical protein EOP05_19090 [Pseudomonadota bacterium]